MATDQKPTDEQLRKAEEKYLRARYIEWIWGIGVFLFFSLVGFVMSGIDHPAGKWANALLVPFILSFISIILIWFGLIRFWHHNFYINKEQEKEKDPFRKIFFGSINIISLILLAAGIFIAFVIMSDGKFFLSIASFIAIVWTVVFLRYFMWSVYFYNINYGLTDQDWVSIYEKRKNKVPEKEIKEPEQNPYKDETFGLPPGTVRGMIAFTLLFGGLALLLASMDMNSEIKDNAYYADHFEFFKTAFLMMIAFYFGDSSLKYLSKNWNKPGKGDGPDTEEPAQNGVDDLEKKVDNLTASAVSKTGSTLTDTKTILQKGGKGTDSKEESDFS